MTRRPLRIEPALSLAEPATAHGRALAPLLHPHPDAFDGLALAVVEVAPLDSPLTPGEPWARLLGFYPARVGLRVHDHTDSDGGRDVREIAALGPTTYKTRTTEGPDAGRVKWARCSRRTAREFHPDAAGFVDARTLAAALDVKPCEVLPLSAPYVITDADHVAAELACAAGAVLGEHGISPAARARVLRAAVAALAVELSRELAEVEPDAAGQADAPRSSVLPFPAPRR